MGACIHTKTGHKPTGNSPVNHKRARPRILQTLAQLRENRGRTRKTMGRSVWKPSRDEGSGNHGNGVFAKRTERTVMGGRVPGYSLRSDRAKATKWPLDEIRVTTTLRANSNATWGNVARCGLRHADLCLENGPIGQGSGHRVMPACPDLVSQAQGAHDNGASVVAVNINRERPIAGANQTRLGLQTSSRLRTRPGLCANKEGVGKRIPVVNRGGRQRKRRRHPLTPSALPRLCPSPHKIN